MVACGAYTQDDEVVLVLQQPNRRKAATTNRLRVRNTDDAAKIVTLALSCCTQQVNDMPASPTKSSNSVAPSPVQAPAPSRDLSAILTPTPTPTATATASGGEGGRDTTPSKKTRGGNHGPDIVLGSAEPSAPTTQKVRRKSGIPALSDTGSQGSGDSYSGNASRRVGAAGSQLLRMNTKRLSLRDTDDANVANEAQMQGVLKFVSMMDGLFAGMQLDASLGLRIDALKSVLGVLVEQIQSKSEHDTGFAAAFSVLRNVCGKLLNCDRSSLFVLMHDDMTDAPYLWTVLDHGQELRIAADRGLSGHCATHREVVNVPDAYEDPRFDSRVDKSTGYKTVGVMCVPVLATKKSSRLSATSDSFDVEMSKCRNVPAAANVEQECIGVLQIVNKIGDDKAFNESDQKVLEAFATMSSVVISSAQTIADEARTHERVDMLNGVSQAVSSTLQAEVIAKRASDNISHYLQDAIVHVVMNDEINGCLSLLGSISYENDIPFQLLKLQIEHGDDLVDYAYENLSIAEICMITNDIVHVSDISSAGSTMLGVKLELAHIHRIAQWDGDELRSCAAIPLHVHFEHVHFHDNAPIGAMCVYAPFEVIGSIEVEALHAVSAVVGSAIANASAFEKAKARGNASAFYDEYAKAMGEDEDDSSDPDGSNDSSKDAKSGKNPSLLVENLLRSGDISADLTDNTPAYDTSRSFDISLVNFDDDSEIKLPAEPVPAPESIDDISFNALDYGPLELVVIVCHMYARHDLVRRAKMNPTTLYRFVYETMKAYEDNPFHNWQHAVTVFQISSVVAKGIREAQNKDYPPRSFLLNDLDVLSLLTAAICHDMGHPGTTNLFHVNTFSELAMTYNDHSVLENFHSACAARLLRDDNTNILSSLSMENYKTCRRMICTAILGTDMSCHHKYLNMLESRIVTTADPETKQPVYTHTLKDTSIEDRELVVQALLHAADLSNPTRGDELSRKWATMLADEMKLQVSKEKELGVPYLPFMEAGFSVGSEVFFVSTFVDGIWGAVSRVFPSCQIFYDNMTNLLESYRAEMVAAKNVAASPRKSADSSTKSLF